MMSVCKPPEFAPRVMSFEEQRDLLFQLGYFISDEMPDFDESTYEKMKGKVRNQLSSDFVDAVARFQEFYREYYAEQFEDGIPIIDGEFGLKTSQAAENMLSRRFCAMPDVAPIGEGLRRWGFMDVSYSHELGRLPGVSAETAHKNYVASWNRWNKVSGLQTHFIQDIRNANVHAHARRIDGRGGTLAWSYMPSNRGSGSSRNERLEQRYDTGDQWAGNPAFQLEVMTHENGHAIGLHHDNSRDANGQRSIMNSSAIGTESLNLNDIRRAVERYGRNTTPDEPTPPPVPAEASILLSEKGGKVRQFIEVPEGWVI